MPVESRPTAADRGSDLPRAGTDGPPPRRRPPTRPVTVTKVETLSPRMRRIVFGGDALDALDGFGPARPGAHIKLIFGKLPAGGLGRDQPRPPMRTYKPRRFDPLRRELTVDFLLHGSGVAGAWAAQARPDDRIHIAGPGGGTEIDTSLAAAVLLVDETAMPAAGMVLPTGEGSTAPV